MTTPLDTAPSPHGFRPLLRVVALWRGQAGWLALGLLVSLAALAFGVALLAAAGARLAGTIAAGAGLASLAAAASLRLIGPARVALRYAERLVTHDATFRALASLRVWFFRGLARGAAGGLGYRRTGDLLSRLVADIEALDGAG